MGMTNKEFISELTKNIPTWKLVLIDKWTDFKVWFWLKTHKGVDNEMTFKESLNNLIELQADYQQFHDDVWQDPESYGIMAESLQMAISIMKKYQKLQEIVRWNNAPSPYYKPDGQLFREICEVLEDGND